ncbi:MAG: lactonase family protein [Burkholderiales bacterium]|nr:lactonase family protein [Burkholderiales bacterium]
MSYQLYVSLQGDNRIARFEMDAASGKLAPRGGIDVVGGPGPMTLSPDKKTIYVGYRGAPEATWWTLNQSGDGIPRPEFGLESFAIDPKTKDLKPKGRRVQTLGEPCYLKTDKHGKFLASSYFQVGRVAIHPIDASGAVTADIIEYIETNSGAHSVQFDLSNRYLFVPHIGLGNRGLTRLPPARQAPANAIFQFKFDEKTGKLTPNDPSRVGPVEQLGPRHFCLHPTRPWMYVCNEQVPSVTMYTLDPERGTLTIGKTVSNLPNDGFKERNTCADIQIHKSGRFVYAPNRGHNSIACYQVDDRSGELTATGWARAEPRPRAFMLDPTGQFLFAGGNESRMIAAYRINQQDGTLTELETYHVGEVPMWLLIVETPDV